MLKGTVKIIVTKCWMSKDISWQNANCWKSERLGKSPEARVAQGRGGEQLILSYREEGNVVDDGKLSNWNLRKNPTWGNCKYMREKISLLRARVAWGGRICSLEGTDYNFSQIRTLNLIYDQTNRSFLSLLEYYDPFGIDMATYTHQNSLMKSKMLVLNKTKMG